MLRCITHVSTEGPRTRSQTSTAYGLLYGGYQSSCSLSYATLGTTHVGTMSRWALYVRSCSSEQLRSRVSGPGCPARLKLQEAR